MYHIYDGEHRITVKAMSLKEIEAAYGSVQKLEASGLRLIKVGNYERL
jgi:hypothetical protein